MSSFSSIVLFVALNKASVNIPLTPQISNFSIVSTFRVLNYQNIMLPSASTFRDQLYSIVSNYFCNLMTEVGICPTHSHYAYPNKILYSIFIFYSNYRFGIAHTKGSEFFKPSARMLSYQI
ncbi:Piso0_000049 [Millerozyma farinosa CBS 7064]|uniref:Piso0_000049 protein n=1 Tax=Pichia sorbitophila (strain ATCC MYA-4447 / BCRC 22081 / CBS 7064 / NBRC 10061 / NRRL Y-12695) TaxID=559304 RepID=G8YSY7_PICSO|nr:Piso0_000049 [Millerozyma farinosa CBS 7064]